MPENGQSERTGRKELDVDFKSWLAAWFRRLADTAPIVDDSPDARFDVDRRERQTALRRIRRELVELVAARRRLEDQLVRLQLRAQRAEERACRAVAAGDDEQARFLLVRKRAALRQIELLAPQRDLLRADELRLSKRERVLALRYEAFRQRSRTQHARKASRGVRLRLAPAVPGERQAGGPASSWRQDAATNGRRSA